MLFHWCGLMILIGNTLWWIHVTLQNWMDCLCCKGKIHKGDSVERECWNTNYQQIQACLAENVVDMLLTCLNVGQMLWNFESIWMSTTQSIFLFWVTSLWHVVVTNHEWAWTCWQKIYLWRKNFLIHKRYCICSIYLQSKNSKKNYTFNCSFN